MILTESQREMIEINAEKIDVMEAHELRVYMQNLYLSKEALGIEVFTWLLRAGELQMANLMQRASVSAMAVISELREGEL